MAPLLAEGVKIPFAITADRTKFDGWRLKDEEAKALGDQADICMQIYFPDLVNNQNSKWAPLAILAATAISLGVSRYVSYEMWKKEEIAKARDGRAHDEKVARGEPIEPEVVPGNAEPVTPERPAFIRPAD